MKPKLAESAVGWYDEPGQAKPTYDPDPETELCPICQLPLEDSVKDVTLTNCLAINASETSDPALQGNRSIFFRHHKACWHSLKPNEVGDMDVEAMKIGETAVAS